MHQVSAADEQITTQKVGVVNVRYLSTVAVLYCLCRGVQGVGGVWEVWEVWEDEEDGVQEIYH